MKNVRLLAALSVMATVPLTSGCMTMLAKMAVGLATTTTTDLSVCAVQAKYITNLYPVDAHTFEIPYYTAGWKEGDDLVTVNCTAREGGSLYQIEGTVQLNGEPMAPMGGGTFSKVVSKADRTPKVISIVTTTGQKAQLTVKPTLPVELLTVNGASNSAKVDVTKDLTLTFGNVPATGSVARIGLITESGGMRNFASLGTYKLDKTVKIPAAAFKHPQLFITSGSHLKDGFRTKGKTLTASSQIVADNNYIFVERYENHALTVENVPAAEQVGLGWSWMKIAPKNDVAAVPGIVTSGTVKDANGGVDYVITKSNAFLGKPLAKAKKFAVVSVALEGRLSRSSVKEEHVSSALSSTTTKHDFNGQKIDGTGDITTVWQFPEVPIAYWDSEIEKFRSDIASAFQEDFLIDVIPYEQMVNARSYKLLNDPTDSFSKDGIQRAYKGNRPLLGARVGTATFASDKTEFQLMRELGVDGLVVVSLGFDLLNDKKGVNEVVTKMSYRIIGLPNDYAGLPVTYSDGEVSTPDGIVVKDDELKDAKAMTRVIRRPELMSAFRTALKAEEAEAKKQGYETVWDARWFETTQKGLSFLNK